MKEKKDIIFYTISKIIIAFLEVLFLSMETKFFSPDVIGDYSLISGLVTALVSVFVSWIGSSALRYYDQCKTNIKEYNRTVFWSEFCSTLLLIFTVFICSLVFPAVPLKEYMFLTVLLVLSKSISEVYEKVLRASRSYKIYCCMIIIQSVLKVALMYTIANNIHSSSSVLYLAVILSTFVFDFVAFFVTKSFDGIQIPGFSHDLIGKFWSYGVPLIGVWGISWLLNYSDRYMIRFFYSSMEVGIYTTSYNVSQSAVGILISSITLAFFPALIRHWNRGGKQEAAIFLNQILDYYIIFLVPATIGLCMIGKHLYGSMIDISYSGGLPVIIWTSFGFFFMGFNNILYKMWQLQEKTKTVLHLMVLSVIMNIILNSICLPIFGYKVAAITTLVSYLLIFMIAVIMICKEFEIRFHLKTIIYVFVASMIMGLFLVLVDSFIDGLLKLFFVIITAAVIYLTTVMLLGGLKDEKETILNYIIRRK